MTVALDGASFNSRILPHSFQTPASNDRRASTRVRDGRRLKRRDSPLGPSTGSRSTGAQDTAGRKGVRRQPKRVALTAQSAPK